ncbi:MAG TPA: peptidase M14 [Flammeovirgaceae bacterium]|nr:peptidase M14 [Flammeovirgaceae bacterium]
MAGFSDFYQHFPDYHVGDITTNRFRVENYHDLLHKLARPFQVATAGHSVEGRPIYRITLGQGPVKVLMWSQMHGNESTASRALLDMLNFFADPGELFRPWVEELLSALTITLVPMLNPDGSARFMRRNALHIDLNREARSLVSPEARLLHDLVKEVKPHVAFNLHDQRRFYNIAGSSKPSTMAFLAPACDQQETVPDNRLRAMQIIATLRQQLEQVIPGQVGLYDDSYSPRAFGDWVQGTGAATILVEAGWQAGDPEKEYVRRLHFATLLHALALCAAKEHTGFAEADYRQIPMNDEKLFDVLLRQLTVEVDGKHYQTDLGIRHQEITRPDGITWYRQGAIEEVGDLQEWYGFAEPDVAGLEVRAGRVVDKMPATSDEALALLREGYLFAEIENLLEEPFTDLPINLVRKGTRPPAFGFEQPANFVLTEKGGAIRFVCLNGFCWEVSKTPPANMHGLVFDRYY